MQCLLARCWIYVRSNPILIRFVYIVEESERAATTKMQDKSLKQLQSALEKSEARADHLDQRLQIDVKKIRDSRDASVTQMQQMRSQLESQGEGLAEERALRDSIAAETSALLVELEDKREQVQRQLSSLSELKRTTDEQRGEIESKRGQTEIITSQMAEINRLREDCQVQRETIDKQTHQIDTLAKAQDKERELLKEKLTSFQEQNDRTVAEVTGQVGPLKSAITELEHERHISDQQRQSLEHMLAESKAAHVSYIQSTDDKIAKLHADLKFQTDTSRTTIHDYDSKLSKLQASNSKATEENATLQERLLQSTQERMALIIKQGEEVNGGKQRIQSLEQKSSVERVQFTNAIQQLQEELKTLLDDKHKSSAQFAAVMEDREMVVRNLQAKAQELSQKVAQSNHRAERQAEIVADLEAQAHASENRARLLEAGLNGLRRQADDVSRIGSLEPSEASTWSDTASIQSRTLSHAYSAAAPSYGSMNSAVSNFASSFNLGQSAGSPLRQPGFNSRGIDAMTRLEPPATSQHLPWDGGRGQGNPHTRTGRNVDTTPSLIGESIRHKPPEKQAVDALSQSLFKFFNSIDETSANVDQP